MGSEVLTLALWMDDVENLYRVGLHLGRDSVGQEVQDANLGWQARRLSLIPSSDERAISDVAVPLDWPGSTAGYAVLHTRQLRAGSGCDGGR